MFAALPGVNARRRSTVSYALHDEILSDSPTAFWWLNEVSGTVVADSSGNGHVGTYEPGASLNQSPFINSVPCIHGDGLGTNYVITVNDDAAFQPGSADFTLIAGIMVSAGSTDRAIYTKERVGADYPEYGLVITTGGLLRFAISSTNGAGGYIDATSVGRVDDGVPHLIVVEKSGSSVTAYVDNVSALSLSFAGSVWDSTNKVGIGCSYILNNSYSTNNVDGYLSHVAWFNGLTIGSTRRTAYQVASGL